MGMPKTRGCPKRCDTVFVLEHWELDALLCFSTRFQFKLFTENAFGGNSCGADEDDDLRGERVVVVASLLGVTLDFNLSWFLVNLW